MLLSLSTPQVLVDPRRVRSNIDRMAAAAASRGLALRPHAKTHKCPEIARWQMDRGAAGICCAKVGEAEVFAAAGIEDIRLPYPVQPDNAHRILKLQEQARISIIVDHLDVACGWSEAMRRAGSSLDVLIKVDVGSHRCGIDPLSTGAVDFVQRIADLPALRLRGLLSHAGHAYAAASEESIASIAEAEARILTDLAERSRNAGVGLEEISVGATPTARFSLVQPGVTELRPGNYVYFDRTQVGLGAASLGDCALTVLATVVSKPAEDRLILDCGSKTLSADPARGFVAAPGYGAVFTDLEATSLDPTLAVERLSEEHAVVRALGPTRLKPGDRVRVLPNHSCVVSNLVDCVQLVEGTRLIGPIQVAARGKIN